MSTTNRVRHALLTTLPKPAGPFTDGEALEMLMAYRKCPGDVPCPLCTRTHGPDTIEVLSFIDPEIDPNGYATVVWPEGSYAAALFCHKCQRAIGILANLEGN